MRLVPPDAAWLDGRRPFPRLLHEAAEQNSGRLEMEEAFGHLGRYLPPSGPPRPIFGNALGCNADSAAMIAADKDYTARLLAAAGLPAPRGMILFSPAYVARMSLKNARVAAALPTTQNAQSFAAELGFPVILKPNSGSEGRGVHLCATPQTLAEDMQALFATDDRLRLEQALAGTDTRITVLDGVVRLAYRRLPLSVRGDGHTRLSDLIARALADLAARHRGAKLAPTDPRIGRALAAQGLDPAAIPEEERTIRLIDIANLSTGGTLEDLTGRLPPEAEALAIEAARAVGLRLAGVDVMAQDLCQSIHDAHVLEVNAAPGLDYYASAGPAQWERARSLVADALRT